jgi:formylglycine-generating enzyme required for sulfatase activity
MPLPVRPDGETGMRVIWLLVTALLLAASPAGAAPERRIALVIGQGAYANAPKLPNPPNDAKAVAEKLGKLGFDVEERLDVDYRALAKAVREFGIRAQSADVAVIFYAGHGMQVDRENYLIPVDAKLEREHDLVYEAMPLKWMLDEVSQAHTLGMVILDACRNNPFVERLSKSTVARSRAVQVGAGLARVDDTPKDTLVAMATRADAVAEDGDGTHSPYTAALLANLEVPGLELDLFFRKVRDAVLKTTRGRQEPFTFGSLGAEPFYFHPVPPNHPPVVAALTPIELTEKAGPVRLGITGLSDPDGDPLVVRLTGLPKGGTLRLGDRVLLIGDSLTPEQLAQVTFTPDGSVTGQAGALAFTVDDGHGSSVSGSLFLKILAANRAPIVGPEVELQTVSHPLGLQKPIDPDGDPLTVTVAAVPSVGAVRKAGGEPLKVGDRLTPEDVPQLVFDPGFAAAGNAGVFSYVVDDGKGGRATANVRLAIGARPNGGGAPSVAAVREPQKTGTPAAGGNHAPDTGSPATPQAAPVQTAAASPPPPPPAPAPAPAAMVPAKPQGAEVRDCDGCPPLVLVKPGSFTMGAAGPGADPAARPPHKVTIARPFYIGRTELTADQWRACVEAGACKDVPELDKATDASPARNLDWNDAQDYLRWLSAKTGHKYRLPSEAEWEYAARGGTATAYWWGDQAGQGKADCEDCGGPHDRAQPASVDAYAANPFGLYGTAGGVAEWVADCWSPSHAGAPKDGSARDKAGCSTRVVRGGSWRNDHSYAASASRFYYDADVRYIGNGFRVLREAP